MKRLLVFIVLICYMNASAELYTNVIDPSRAPSTATGGGWPNAGATIPVRTTICSTLTSANTLAQINSAISGCADGQVVFLSAGTYTLSSGLIVNSHNNVTIRGAGANQTFLVFSGSDPCHGFRSDICVESSDQSINTSPSNVVNWTSGYSQGTTSIVLATVPNLKVGAPIILDQTDDVAATGGDAGGIIETDSNSTITPTNACGSAPCGSPGPFSLEGNGGGAQRSGRQEYQIVKVTGCNGDTTPGDACSGSSVTVTISPGLYMPNWSSSRTPQAWWATNPISGVGIENLSVDVTNGGSTTAGIEFFNAINFWQTGTTVIDTGRAHTQILHGSHGTIANNYLFLTQNSVSQSYGVEVFAGSDILIENNIAQAVASPWMINGPCSGCVVGYNYGTNNYYTASPGFSVPTAYDHTAGQDNILFEGNVGGQMHGDNFHGPAAFITNFRNRWQGLQPACWSSGGTYATSTFAACNNGYTAASIDAFHRDNNLIGNILGTSANTSYLNGSRDVLDVGQGNVEGPVTVPTDPNTLYSVMLWGNYDTVNAAVRFNCAEVPSSLTGTQAAFSNPCPASNALPPSFYHASVPSFWPALKPWPAIGPDVTGGNVGKCTSGSFTAGEGTSSGQCNGGSFSASILGGHINSIPAQDCFLNIMGGNPWGTGPVLSFNAATCYPPTVTSVSRVISGSHKLGGGRFVP